MASDNSFFAKRGIRLGFLGSPSDISLALYDSITGDNDPHTASNRTGLWGSLASNAEALGFIVGGLEGPRFQSDGTKVEVIVPGLATGIVRSASGTLTSTAGLDGSDITTGTIDPARLPAIALNTIQVVADAAARLALTNVEPGDAVKESSTGATYLLQTLPASSAGNWILISDVSPDWTSISNIPADISSLGSLSGTGVVVRDLVGTLSVRALTSTDIPNLPATKLTSGLLDAQRLVVTNTAGWLKNDGVGGLSWTTPTKTDVGLGNVVNVDQTNASNIVSGTLSRAYGGTGLASPTGYIKFNGGSAPTVSTTIPGADVSGNIPGNAAGLTATLAVSSGGTGATTLTGYLKGNGTSAFTATSSIPGSDVSGNISGNAANVTGTVLAANGGTGLVSPTGYIKFNGVSAATMSASIPGSDVSGNISGNAANVTGIVAMANGGTGKNNTAPSDGQFLVGSGGLFATGSINAGSNISISYAAGSITINNASGTVNPMTTLGDTIYGAAGGVVTRLPGQTTSAKLFLTQTGTGAASAAPAWAAITTADLGTGTANSSTFLRGDGTWAVAGGTVTGSGAANQVAYWSSSSVLTSSSNLTYDGAILTVDRGTGALPTSFVAASNCITFANATSNPNIEAFGFGGTAFSIYGRAIGGTRGTISATTDFAGFLNFAAGGYDGTAHQVNAANYSIRADGLWSGTNRGAFHLWNGTTNGSISSAEWMRLQGGTLTVDSGTANGSLPAANNLTSTPLRIGVADASRTRMEILSFAVNGGILHFRSASSPRATPGAVSGSLGGLWFGGYDGTAWIQNPITIEALADGAWSGSNNGTYLVIQGTSANQLTANRAEWLRIQNGNVGIGGAPVTYAAPSALQVFSGAIRVGNAHGMIIGADGGYLGVGTYYNGTGWARVTANQGGAVIRNTGGQFEIWTGAAATAAVDTVITGFGRKFYIDGAGNTVVENGNLTVTSNTIAQIRIIGGASGGAALEIDGQTGLAAAGRWRIGDGIGTSNGVLALYDYKNSALRLTMSASGDITFGNANTAAGGLRYFDIQNAETTNTGSGVVTRFITYNAAGTSTTSADIVKYRNGAWVFQNNENNGSAYIQWLVNAGTSTYLSEKGMGVGAYPSAAFERFRVEQLSTSTTNDGTAAFLLNYARPSAAASRSYYAAYCQINADVANNNLSGSNILGVQSLPVVAVAGTATVNAAFGVHGYPQLSNSGSSGTTLTVNNVYGLYTTLYMAATNAGATTYVGNYYGLFLATPSTATGSGTKTINARYGVYQEDGSATNYFAGNTGVGKIPEVKLHAYISSGAQNDALGIIQAQCFDTNSASVITKNSTNTCQFMTWIGNGLRVGNRVGTGGIYFTYNADAVGGVVDTSGIFRWGEQTLTSRTGAAMEVQGSISAYAASSLGLCEVSAVSRLFYNGGAGNNYAGLIMRYYDTAALGSAYGVAAAGAAFLISQNTSSLNIGSNTGNNINFFAAGRVHAGNTGNLLGCLNAGGALGLYATPGTGAFASRWNGASTDFNYILAADNDTGNKAVMFVNGSGRIADGGYSGLTFRNDGGALTLGNAAYYTYHAASISSFARPAVIGGASYVSGFGHLQVGPYSSIVGDSVEIASFCGTSVATGSSNAANVAIHSATAFATDLGGTLGLGGRYNSGNQFATFAMLKGSKGDSVDGNYGGYLSLLTRVNGGSLVERLRVTQGGNLAVATAPDFAGTPSDGVTGRFNVSTDYGTIVMAGTDRPKIVWQYDRQTSGTYTGYGRWGFQMFAGVHAAIVPGTDYAAGQGGTWAVTGVTAAGVATNVFTVAGGTGAVIAAGSITATNQILVGRDNLAVSSGLYSVAQLQVKTIASGNPGYVAVGFHRLGIDAQALFFGGSAASSAYTFGWVHSDGTTGDVLLRRRTTATVLQNSTTLAAGIYQNGGDGLQYSNGTASALTNWWHVINMVHTDYNGYNAQLAVNLSLGGCAWSVPGTDSANWMFVRKATGGTWNEWSRVLTSENGIERYQIFRGTDPTAIPTVAQGYLHLGAPLNATTGGYRMITAGYHSGANYAPVAFGYQQTSLSGFTLGDFVVATRSVTTDIAPSVVLRVDSVGTVTTVGDVILRYGTTAAGSLLRWVSQPTAANSLVPTTTNFTPTLAGSGSIAANTLQTGATITVSIRGKYNTDATANRQFNLNIALGSTTITVSTFADLPASALGAGFTAEYVFTVGTPGASATYRGHAWILYATSNTTGAHSFSSTAANSTTLNTTTSNSWVFSTSWSATAAACTVTITSLEVKIS